MAFEYVEILHAGEDEPETTSFGSAAGTRRGHPRCGSPGTSGCEPRRHGGGPAAHRSGQTDQQGGGGQAFCSCDWFVLRPTPAWAADGSCCLSPGPLEPPPKWRAAAAAQSPPLGNSRRADGAARHGSRRSPAPSRSPSRHPARERTRRRRRRRRRDGLPCRVVAVPPPPPGPLGGRQPSTADPTRGTVWAGVASHRGAGPPR